jgi:nucleotide-binding universal stress UspA family protein
MTHFSLVNSNILIAVDGSKFSEEATHVGIELAKALKATVTFLCVVDISNLVSTASVGGIVDSEILQIYHEEAEKVVDALIKKFPYEKIRKIIPEGMPAETIMRNAKSEKADLIIMGTHGRTGIKHMLMGSVAEDVLRHSNIPVLVVPSHEKNK